MLTKRKLGVLLVCLILGLMGFWLLWPGIDASVTYEIAEEAFQKYAKHMDKAEEDFVPPARLNPRDSDPVVQLDWRSRSRPNCAIEVVVDRKTVNAMPSWQCS